MCGVVLPLVQGQDKLGAGDQAQGGGGEGEDVVPDEDACLVCLYLVNTHNVRHENWHARHASLHPLSLTPSLSMLHLRQACM